MKKKNGTYVLGGFKTATKVHLGLNWTLSKQRRFICLYVSLLYNSIYHHLVSYFVFNSFIWLKAQYPPRDDFCYKFLIVVKYCSSVHLKRQLLCNFSLVAETERPIFCYFVYTTIVVVAETCHSPTGGVSIDKL